MAGLCAVGVPAATVAERAARASECVAGISKSKSFGPTTRSQNPSRAVRPRRPTPPGPAETRRPDLREPHHRRRGRARQCGLRRKRRPAGPAGSGSAGCSDIYTCKVTVNLSHVVRPDRRSSGPPGPLIAKNGAQVSPAEVASEAGKFPPGGVHVPPVPSGLLAVPVRNMDEEAGIRQKLERRYCGGPGRGIPPVCSKGG